MLTEKVDSGNTADNQQYRYHTTTTHTQPQTGLPVKVTSPNQTSQLYAYDGMKRLIQTLSAGYKTQYIRYHSPDGYQPRQNNRYLSYLQVTTSQDGTPTTYQYLDAFDRALRTTITGFNNQRIHQDTQYTERGLVKRTSAPFAHNASVIWTTNETFDSLGRVTRKYTPSAQTGKRYITQYSYVKGNTHISTDANHGHNLSMIRQHTSQGLLLRTIDAHNERTAYAYNANGQPVIVQDAKENNIIAYYDDMGRKKRVSDPNQGVTHFYYTDFNELKLEHHVEHHSSGTKTYYDHDRLGRVTRKYNPQGGDAVFTYDRKSLGALHKTYRNGHTIEHSFDELGRVTQTKHSIDATHYLVKQHFDNQFGRLTRLTYPSQANLAIDYTYKANTGYLESEKNASTGYVYRRITEQDIWGNISKSSLGGNRITTESHYSERNGQMLSTIAKKGMNMLHNWQYTQFDSYGNLKEQRNTRYYGSSSSTMVEKFGHDPLHRLKWSEVDGNYGINPGDDRIYYTYDSVGNITSKTDFSNFGQTSYQYHAGTNKLKSVARRGNIHEWYGHDGRGNLTHRNNTHEITYNGMNKPTWIKRHGSTVNLYYGANDMRYKQVRTVSGTTTTHYIDKLFEVEIKGSAKTYTSYISDVAILSSKEGLKFTLKDRLGSTTTLTNDAATDVTYRNFDPFGKPRQVTGKRITYSSYGAKLSHYNDDTTRRGFTDHEHLDEVELIHMNGRLYDYNVGRFLSVDPFIHGNGNSQGINPYSYILNNPLAGTDPSGYSPECSRDDLACQWDQSISSVTGVPREEITAMYNQQTANQNNGSDQSQQQTNTQPSDASNINSTSEFAKNSEEEGWLQSAKDWFLSPFIPSENLHNTLDPTNTGRVEEVKQLFESGQITEDEYLMYSDILNSNAKMANLVPVSKGETFIVGVSVVAPLKGLRGAKGVTKNVDISRARYGDAAEHIADAQRAGHPSVLTIARDGAAANRKASIGGIPKVTGKQLDEYPPAMFKEGGAGASVRAISPKNNMAAGACIGNACRGLANGEKVRIRVVD